MVQRLEGFRAAFPVVPFSGYFSPQLAVGLLKAILVDEGASIHDLYLNLELAARLGFQAYGEIAGSGRILLPEWLFSSHVFGEPRGCHFPAKHKESIAKIAKSVGEEDPDCWLQSVHNSISDWLDLCAKTVDWNSYHAIFFSCCFAQLFPALALAKRIKNRFPTLPVVFGGSEIFFPLAEELSSKVDFVDVWVVGEGDEIIVEIAESIHRGEPIKKINFGRICKDLSSLPTPDFAGYFEMLSALQRARMIGKDFFPRLPLEMSRGCWWAEKNQCTFCSIVGEHKQHRSKSPEKILGEISHHGQTYESFAFQASDCILSRNAFGTLLQPLSQFRGTIDLIVEVKSSLNHQQLLALKKAGISAVQPGIESINTHILQLMRKGCNSATNVLFLKNAFLAGLKCCWNLLLGFPGESEEDYQAMLSLIPKLSHLEAPYWTGLIRLERGSPLWASVRMGQETEGFYTDMRPREDYSYCYPEGFDFNQLAWFYTASRNSRVKPDTYEQVMQMANSWTLT